MRPADNSENIDVPELYGYVTHKWSRTLVQPLLIALVVTAFFTILTAVVPILLPIPPTIVWLVPLIFLACLEGVYTTLWLADPSRRHLNQWAYRAAEFLVVVLLLRLFVWLAFDTLPSATPIVLLLRNPQLLVNDSLFLLSVLIVFLAWLRAIFTTNDFAELAIDGAEAHYFALPAKDRKVDMKPSFSDRGAVVAQILQTWVFGGMVLAMVTAVMKLDPFNNAAEKSLIGLKTLNLPPSTILALVVYFVGGLLLLSQARLGAVNARWLHQGVLKMPEVERSWNRYTLRLLLLIAFIALFLPLGSTFAIGRLLQSIIVGAVYLATLIGYLFTFLLASLLSLFPTPQSSEPLNSAPPEVLPTPAPTPTPAPPNPPSEMLQILASSAFWAVAIVVTLLALGFFLRDRGVPLNLGLFKIVGLRIVNWVRGLWHDVADYAEDLGQDVRRRWRKEPEDSQEKEQAPWRFVRLNSLSARDQIRYFYLSTVKRADARGVPRQQGETPLEFSADLKETWPEAEAEIDELTEAFLRAQYSQDNIEKEELKPVKKQWQQVKKNLRKRRKKENK